MRKGMEKIKNSAFAEIVAFCSKISRKSQIWWPLRASTIRNNKRQYQLLNTLAICMRTNNQARFAATECNRNRKKWSSKFSAKETMNFHCFYFHLFDMRFFLCARVCVCLSYFYFANFISRRQLCEWKCGREGWFYSIHNY